MIINSKPVLLIVILFAILSSLFVYSLAQITTVGNGTITFNGTVIANQFVGNFTGNVTTVVPAEDVIAGTFGANTGNGNFVFPNNLTVLETLNVSGTQRNSTIRGDLTVNGTIYGGSPVKIAGGLNVTGVSNLEGIFVDFCVGCGNGSLVQASNVSNGTFQSGTYVFPDNLTVGNLSVIQNVQLLNLPYQCTGDNTLDIIDGIVACGSDQKGPNGTVTTLHQGLGVILQPNPITIEGNITINEAFFNATFVRYSNLTFFNESGISRNLTSILISPAPFFTVSLPDQDIITIKTVVKGLSDPNALTLHLNDDNQTNYAYKRIQSYRFLQQAITVNPQQNVTLEGYTVTSNRTLEIKLTNNPGFVIGEWTMTAGLSNMTIGPLVTHGSFVWSNTTSLNSLTIRVNNGTIDDGSYMIVTSERK